MNKELTLEEKYTKTTHLLQCLLKNGYIGIECFDERWYDDQNSWIENLLFEIEPELVTQAKREATDFKEHNKASEIINSSACIYAPKKNYCENVTITINRSDITN